MLKHLFLIGSVLFLEPRVAFSLEVNVGNTRVTIFEGYSNYNGYSGHDGKDPNQAVVKIVDIKAYDCPPCKQLEETVLKHVKNRYLGDKRVFIGSVMGYLGNSGYYSAKKSYCAVKLGGVFSIIEGLIFEDPNINADRLTSVSMIDARSYQNCYNSEEASNFLSESRNQINRLRVPHYPYAYLNGRVFDSRSLSTWINAIENSLTSAEEADIPCGRICK